MANGSLPRVAGRNSLRTRFLGIVVAGAVLPLAAVGLWLSTTAIRSGETLLRSQLDESLTRQAGAITTAWRHRTSDATLLADNEPLRAAMSSDTTLPPAFLVSAFATMPALQSATIRDSTGRVRFSLGDQPLEGIGRPDGAVAPSPTINLVVPVRDAAGTRIGDVEIRVRVSALIAATDGGPDAPMLAARDRSSGAWLLTPTAPVSLLTNGRFTWQDQQWLVVRRRVEEPAIDLVMASRLDPIIAPFARNARIGWIALGAAAVVVMLVTVLATIRMTRSLTQLAVAADAVAHGDLDQRLESKGDDEVARVSRAFNSMTDSLRRMIRERSQGEALAAMGELAAVLAHQVRSPLTAMRIDLQRVEGRVGADGDRELVGRAIQQLDRLERSVGGALRIAKSAAGTFEMVDLHAPLGRAISGLEHQVRARGTVLESSDDANGRLTIRGDAATLEQLFANIILNAAEATEGGRITVRSLRENGRVTVLVEDTGIGMAADTLGRIFEPYYSTKPDGTGIGLAVAQRIVKAHGGDIAITSEAGHGTRVTVSFAAIDSTPG